jgi:hypothetical protein
MTDADVTLTALNGVTDQARSAVITCVGTNTAIRSIIIPTISKTYIVRNSTTGGFAITVKTTGVGALVATIPNGAVATVYCDGTDTYAAVGSASMIGLGNVNNTSDANKPVSTAQAAAILQAMPTGAIINMPCTTAPTGYLPVWGTLISRTTYANLWTFAQASGNIASSDTTWSSSLLFGQFSPGDGSTTFRIPYLAGVFVRSWISSGGWDSGRAIGAYQAGDVLSHNHAISDPGHSHGLSQSAHGHGVSDPGHAHSIYGPTNQPVQHDASLEFDTTINKDGYTTGSSTNGTGISIVGNTIPISVNGAVIGITINSSGSESRPINVAMPYFIKY